MEAGYSLGNLREANIMIVQLFGWLDTRNVAQNVHQDTKGRRRIIRQLVRAPFVANPVPGYILTFGFGLSHSQHTHAFQSAVYWAQFHFQQVPSRYLHLSSTSVKLVKLMTCLSEFNFPGDSCWIQS